MCPDFRFQRPMGTSLALWPEYPICFISCSLGMPPLKPLVLEHGSHTHRDKQCFASLLQSVEASYYARMAAPSLAIAQQDPAAIVPPSMASIQWLGTDDPL
ncbi:hypothetical protein NDU88_003316 [Pleurodeles waltl]|uniref:Uncharacterized protein n=1 Tax=Pleurodeles waltl TaxID=8319 RepID=A0AAV7NG20_PLEWA|nr:hypothetical protein NDU88_003316 [Pleurodeles waltl]